jgi:hypothetical protein
MHQIQPSLFHTNLSTFVLLNSLGARRFPVYILRSEVFKIRAYKPTPVTATVTVSVSTVRYSVLPPAYISYVSKLVFYTSKFDKLYIHLDQLFMLFPNMNLLLVF